MSLHIYGKKKRKPLLLSHTSAPPCHAQYLASPEVTHDTRISESITLIAPSKSLRRHVRILPVNWARILPVNWARRRWIRNERQMIYDTRITITMNHNHQQCQKTTVGPDATMETQTEKMRKKLKGMAVKFHVPICVRMAPVNHVHAEKKLPAEK